MSPEVELRVVALRQHGVFTLTQALRCGFTRPVVRRRLERRAWEEVAPRVYRVAASRPIDWRQRPMAIALASGGVSAGLAAAALHDLAAPPPKPEIRYGAHRAPSSMRSSTPVAISLRSIAPKPRAYQ